MRNITEQLQPAYYTKINALAVLPVYNGMAPDTAKGSYIVIGDVNVNQTQGKQAFKQDVSVLVDIVIKDHDFGFKEAERVAGLVMGAIDSNTAWALADFQVITTQLESKSRLSGLTSMDKVFRVLLRYGHNVVEK